MQSSRAHYKYVINMMNRYLYHSNVCICISLFIICALCLCKLWISLCQKVCRILTMIASWSEKDEVPTCAVQRNRIGSPSLQYAWSRQRPSRCVACGGFRRDLKPFSKSSFRNAWSLSSLSQKLKSPQRTIVCWPSKFSIRAKKSRISSSLLAFADL